MMSSSLLSSLRQPGPEIKMSATKRTFFNNEVFYDVKMRFKSRLFVQVLLILRGMNTDNIVPFYGQFNAGRKTLSLST